MHILIGSRAIKKYYNLENIGDHTDYDIITDQPECFNVDDPKLKKYKLDIIDITDPKLEDPTFRKIHDYCVANPKALYKTAKFIGDNITLVICPFNILYALLRATLYRILPYGNSQTERVLIWFKRVDQYNKVNNQMSKYLRGYYTSMVYKPDRYDPIAYDIFQSEFNYAISKIGDTRISLTETKEAFFKDNVKRYCDHDELHKIVAMHNRGDEEPIYTRILNNNNVGLDESKFNRLSTSNKVNMLREEWYVLLLERKLIPTFIECQHPDEYLKSNRMYTDIMEILAHFATNLCGQGHHWLRIYVIDHIEVIKIYDAEMLIKIAVSIAEKHNSNLQNIILDPIDNFNELLDVMNPINNSYPREVFWENNYEIKFINGVMPIAGSDCPNASSPNSIYPFNEHFQDNIIDEIHEIDNTDGNHFIIYNKILNKGLITRDGIIVDTLRLYTRREMPDIIRVTDNTLDPNPDDKLWSNNTMSYRFYKRNVYYYSISGWDVCGQNPEYGGKQGSVSYVNRELSYYGSFDPVRNAFVTYYVRKLLDIDTDYYVTPSGEPWNIKPNKTYDYEDYHPDDDKKNMHPNKKYYVRSIETDNDLKNENDEEFLKFQNSPQYEDY